MNEAIARVSADNCDVILVSATLPDNSALKLIKRLRQEAGPAKILVTGLPNDPQQILNFIVVGAASYVLAQEGVQSWVKHKDASTYLSFVQGRMQQSQATYM